MTTKKKTLSPVEEAWAENAADISELRSELDQLLAKVERKAREAVRLTVRHHFEQQDANDREVTEEQIYWVLARVAARPTDDKYGSMRRTNVFEQTIKDATLEEVSQALNISGGVEAVRKWANGEGGRIW